MEERLITKWNAVVAPTDEVFVLGDVAMKDRMVSLQYYERLKGKKFQVPGNHDHNGPWNKSAPHWWPIYAKLFTILPYITQVKLGEHRVDLCHFPHTSDHTEEERFLQWRPKDSGRWLLHGHSHGALGSVRPATREIDVGVDCWDLDTCA